MAALGSAGTRFTSLTIGANQFDKPEDRSRFFNWCFVAQYVASVIGATVMVYIQDNVSWGLGFGLCAGANAIGLLIFLLGKRLYRPEDGPRGSPYGDLARVVVAAVKKRNIRLTLNNEDYYYGHHGQVTETAGPTSKKKFRFLNRAALKTEGDIRQDGSVAKPWRLCTMQQVEDFKTLLRIFPLWSSGILLSTTIVTQGSLVILQALAMDRHLGPHFKIPAGSMWVLSMISLSISLTLSDRVFSPIWRKAVNRSFTVLQWIGVGHILNTLSLVVASVVEAKRLGATHHHQKLSSLLLFPQLILVGVGLSLHHPGQAAFFYQEFPLSLRSTATAMASVTIGIGYYLSTLFLDLFRRVTEWLPNNINDGRADNVYWTLVAVGMLNFVYYLICAGCYKYQIRNSEGIGGANGNSASNK
ncbi:hypothetical protein CDL15_Pgr028146 [Punica granatum]|nr:hypothetical protein CDL15_Pgr028146 [Punica granatum]PKI54936.1 hypothetical protein CRG98_024669 [Punica granatum]